jgi:hypothetical protein
VTDELDMRLAGLVAEHKVYWLRTDDEDEACFLLGWVNAPAVDEVVRPRAMYGKCRERNIEKRIVEIGPPRFVKSDTRHVEMASLARQAADVAAKLAPSLAGRSLATARRAVRTHREIAPLRKRIDELAAEIGGF